MSEDKKTGPLIIPETRGKPEWWDAFLKVAQNAVPAPRGCVCPPGSEATCQGPLCPRKPVVP